VRQLLAPHKQQAQAELSGALHDAMADFGTKLVFSLKINWLIVKKSSRNNLKPFNDLFQIRMPYLSFLWTVVCLLYNDTLKQARPC
jgi:hypothetical protein